MDQFLAVACCSHFVALNCVLGHIRRKSERGWRRTPGNQDGAWEHIFTFLSLKICYPLRILTVVARPVLVHWWSCRWRSILHIYQSLFDVPVTVNKVFVDIVVVGQQRIKAERLLWSDCSDSLLWSFYICLMT